jgi:hypothetical protein
VGTGGGKTDSLKRLFYFSAADFLMRDMQRKYHFLTLLLLVRNQAGRADGQHRPEDERFRLPEMQHL